MFKGALLSGLCLQNQIEKGYGQLMDQTNGNQLHQQPGANKQFNLCKFSQCLCWE